MRPINKDIQSPSIIEMEEIDFLEEKKNRGFSLSSSFFFISTINAILILIFFINVGVRTNLHAS
jgi:hypothetical protein